MRTCAELLFVLFVAVGISACSSDSSGLDMYGSSYDRGDDYESEDQEIDYEEEVSKRVRVREIWTDAYSFKLEIKSELPEILDDVTVRYGVRRYLLCEYCNKYDKAEDFVFNYMDENTDYYIEENLPYSLDSNYAMYYRMYTTLTNKLASGQTLSESEQKLLGQVKDELEAILSVFRYDVFVEIFWYEYPVDGYWQYDVEPA